MTKRIAIVGFGYIGTCIGAVLADRGYHVTGIEPRQETVEEIGRGETSLHEPGLPELVKKAHAAGRLRATSDYAACQEADVIVVTVGTPLGAQHEPDMSQVRAASAEIAKRLKRGQLVMFKSTVPPGTTEDVVRPALEAGGLRCGTDFHLAFCPERLAEGKAIAEFLALPVVVGGADDASTKAAAAFWREALGVRIVEVSNARAAELSKLADNLWIDLNVALANELAMLCDKVGADVMEVIAAANTLPKGQHHVNILTPGAGVGGYCLTKDPWFVHHMGKEHGLDMLTPVASRRANDRMPAYTAHRIEEELAKKGRRLAGAKVAVLGIAMKANTGDVRFTPTKDVIASLKQAGARLAICDPWVHPKEVHSVTDLPVVHDVAESLRDADAVVVLAGHDQFKQFPLDKLAALAKPGAVVLDGRGMYSKEQAADLRARGLVFRGVGR